MSSSAPPRPARDDAPGSGRAYPKGGTMSEHTSRILRSDLHRRGFLRAAGGTALGSILLSGCGGSAGEGEAGGLEVWAAFGTDEERAYYEESVLGAFNASQDAVTAEVSVKQEDTIDRLLQTAMAAGQGPDIIPTSGPAYAAPYVTAGQFLALDDIAAERGWTERLLPWALATGTIEGALHAIPAGYESMVLLYNPATFEANGWTPPTSREEFEAICADAADQGMMPVAAGNAEWQPASEWHVTNTWNTAVGADGLFQALSGDLPWTDAVFVDSIALLKRWFDDGWFGGGAQPYFTNEFGPLYNALATGDAAMMLTGSWGMAEASDYFGEAAGNDAVWEWAPLPSLSQQVPAGIYPLGVGSTLSVNADTASAEDAAAYIDFLLDPQLQGQGLAEVEAQPYPVQLTDADFPAGVDARLKRFYLELSASTNVGYTTWTFWPPKSDTYIYKELDKVLLGDVSPAEYCAGLDEVFQTELADGVVPPVTDFTA